MGVCPGSALTHDSPWCPACDALVGTKELDIEVSDGEYMRTRVMKTHDTPIRDFRGPFRWLSNFQEAEVEYEGDLYPTTEHAYQAAKTLDPEERKLVREQATPGYAKRLGRQVTMRPNWDDMKAEVMLEVTRQKYTRHQHLRERLLGTGNAYLEEGNTWHDNFFGVCSCSDCQDTKDGLNILGKIVMIVREELRSGKRWEPRE